MPLVDRNAPIVTEYARCGNCYNWWHPPHTPNSYYRCALMPDIVTDEYTPDCGHWEQQETCAWYSHGGGLCIMHGYAHCIHCESYLPEGEIEDITDEEYDRLWEECYTKLLKEVNKP